MQCPYCNSSAKVTNSRSHNNNAGVWRRRQCISCNAVWTTQEKYDLSTTHSVKNSSSERLTAFSRDNLFVSIFDSLSHRKTAISDSTALTNTIIGHVLAQNSSIIPTEYIKTISVDVLLNFDKTAAGVYRAKQRSI